MDTTTDLNQGDHLALLHRQVNLMPLGTVGRQVKAEGLTRIGNRHTSIPHKQRHGILRMHRHGINPGGYVDIIPATTVGDGFNAPITPQRLEYHHGTTHGRKGRIRCAVLHLDHTLHAHKRLDIPRLNR